jgi:hypothetical protein
MLFFTRFSTTICFSVLQGYFRSCIARGRYCQLAPQVKSATFCVIRNGYFPNHPYPSAFMYLLGKATCHAQWLPHNAQVVVNPQIVTPLPSLTLLPSRQCATKLELGSLFAGA